MYVDLVGSTELSEVLEPEAYSDAIVRYRDAVGPAISNGGTIVRFTGDGILAYFGYPKAAANDPARAVYAALQATAALVSQTVTMPDGRRTPLRARIGVHTGMTVIGDLEGAGVIEVNAAVGHAANVAARVQAAAKPGQVAISEETLRLVEAHFHTRPMGAMVLKGVSQAMTLYEVIAPTNVSAGLRRPLLRHGRGIWGRDSELAVLQAKWRRASLARGSAMLIGGEAGIGKSRLVRDFLDDNEVKENGAALIVECLEQRKNSAFQPFRELLVASLGVIEERTVEALERQLGRTFDLPAQSVTSLSHFLLGTIPDASLSPAKIREDLISALLAWIESQQVNGPRALLVEDLHWADDSTLLLLERILLGVESMRLLLLMTAREDFTAPIVGDFRLNKLRLAPLDSTMSRELLLDCANGSVFPEAALQRFVQQAEGNPLFLEELACSWQDKYGGGQAVSGVAVPPSLRDALMERLDSAGNAKGLAQFAAVLGQTFPIGLLEACDNRNSEEVLRDLSRLVEASILRRRAGSTEQEYEFRHALVREVAHDSVLPRTRASYHRRIAETIRARLPEISEARPEVLAWHLEQAGEYSDAVDLWLLAGQKAAALSANVEALAHLSRADSLLRQTDESLPARAERTLDVLLAMGGPLIAQRGWAADPVDAVYLEAIDICQSLEDERKLFNVLRGRQNVLLLRGDLATCQEISRRLLQMAEKSGEDTLFLEARRGLGVCAFLAGRFDEAIEELDRAIKLFQPALHNDLATVYGVNPGVVAMSWRAWASSLVGNPSSAAEFIAQATALARMANHPFSEGYALCFAASIAQCNGDASEALRCAELAIDLAKRRGYPYWHAWAGIVRGWAKGMAGETTVGLRELEGALSEYQSLGAKMIVGYAHVLAAELANGQQVVDQAFRHVKAAEESMSETGMKFCDSLLEPQREKLRAIGVAA